MWEAPYGALAKDELATLKAKYSQCGWGRYHTKIMVVRISILSEVEMGSEDWYQSFSNAVFSAENRSSERARELFQKRTAYHQKSHANLHIRSFIEFITCEKGVVFRVVDKEILLDVLDVDGRLSESNWNPRRGAFEPLKLAVSIGLLVTQMDQRNLETHRYFSLPSLPFD
jgi:hypothetical protein